MAFKTVSKRPVRMGYIEFEIKVEGWTTISTEVISRAIEVIPLDGRIPCIYAR